jgi:hypothetical protein
VDLEDTRTALPGATRLVLQGDVGVGELRVGPVRADNSFLDRSDGPVNQFACYATG